MSFQSNELNLAVNSLVRRENEHRQGIKTTQSLANSCAGRLARGGKLEELLGGDVIAKHRESLKKISEENIHNERKLQAYVNALQTLNAEEKDFAKALDKSVSNELVKLKQNSVPITQEKNYVDLCKALGEQEGGDDELEVLAADNSTNLKCPITQQLMVDPVKSSVCKHTYSREGILHHLKGVNSKNCPVAGCCHHVSKNNLEDDEETALLVRRAKKRAEVAKRSQSQTAVEMDDDEEEETVL
jgi:hypothetical protein